MENLGTFAQDARMNVAGRLERLPVSRAHVILCSIVGIAMFFDGYDLFMTGLALPSLVKSGMLAEGSRAYFISLPLFAAALGSVLAGIVGDRVGRRRLIIANLAIYSIAGLACGLSSNYPVLLACRTIGMLALGMQIPTGYAYISEFIPHAARGRFQSVLALLVNGALPFFALVAWIVLPHLPASMSWRVLFGISVIALPLAAAPASLLPESPRWLMSMGRDAQADAIVARIEAGYARRGITLAAPAEIQAPVRDLGWSALLAPGMWRRSLLAVLFQIFQLSSIFVLVNWLPTLMAKRGLGLGASIGYSGLSFAGNLLGPIIGILIADRFERRWLLVTASVIGAVMSVVYSHQTGNVAILATGVVLTASIFFISAVGYGAYLPEILPTGVRLRGMGGAALVGRVASALTPFIVVAALARVADPFDIILGVGALYALLALSFIVLGPNTHGQTLETLESQAFGVRSVDEPGADCPRAYRAER